MIPENEENSNLVYTTDKGAVCLKCSQAKSKCVCRELKKAAIPQTDGAARLGYEKNRKGKGVTLISGLALNETDLLGLAKKLKQRFGVGGSVKGYVIELQGDFREQIAQELVKLGYRIK